MHRRNFAAVLVGVLLTPFSFLRCKPAAAASGQSGCPEGARGKEGPSGPKSPPSPWYDPEHVNSTSRRNFDTRIHLRAAYPVENYKPSDRLIPVDHALLKSQPRYPHYGRTLPKSTSLCQFTRTPIITLEHWDGEGKPGSPGKLIIDQRLPTHAAELAAYGAKAKGYPVDPRMCRVMQFDLADPYQLLLADVMVRGLMDAGVIDNASFIASWLRVVIDSQNHQYSEEARESDPDAPVEFVTGSLGREIAAGRKPSPGSKVSPNRVTHTCSAGVVAAQLSEHCEAVAEQERRRRKGPPFPC